MTRAKKVLGGIAALALAMFLAPGIAQAADYSGNCAGVPSSVTGNVSITDTSCALPNSVSATGYIHITADSISGSGKNLSSGTEIDINTTGNTTVGNLTASNYYIRVRADNISAGDVKTTTYGNILLYAQGSLDAEDVEGAPGYNIDLKANRAGGNGLFTIGSTGSNVQSITAHGSGSSPYYASTVIYVTNGNASSTGGITVSDPSKITAPGGSGSRSGHIILNAQNGTLTISTGVTGTLSVDGADGAGSIGLMANTVAFGNDATVTASQGPSVAGKRHGIDISATDVTFGGTNGLTLHADGNGYDQYNTGFVQLLAKGAISVSDTEDPSSLTIYGTVNPYMAGEVDYQGSGSAPLVVTANGNNSGVWGYGYPVMFSGGTVLLQSVGASNHNINLVYYGTTSGLQALQFNGGNVTVDASGPLSGDGNGGNINVTMDNMYRSSGGNATFKVNGPSSGTGPGGLITVNAGAAPVFDLGTAVGRYAFSAKGGSLSGNGGEIRLYPYSATMTVYGAGPSTTVLDVSAPGTSGNGGDIDIQAFGGITFDGSASYLKADSASSDGNGGTIIVRTSAQAMTIGNGTSGAVNISATGADDGGTIDIISYSGLTINSANIAVTAGPGGEGGKLFLSAPYATVEINGNLDASGGSGNSTGGQIVLSAGYLTLPGGANTSLLANAQGTGTGGSIGLVTKFSNIDIGLGNGEVKLEATSDDGDGGSITLTTNNLYDINLVGAALSVSAGTSGGNGTGGDINANATTGTITVTGTLTSSGYASGQGGNVQLLANEIDLDDGTIVANGGATGPGGLIDLQSTTSLTVTGSQITVTPGASGNGVGGTIRLISTDGNVTATGTFDASGHGNGNGGEIEISAASNTLTVTGGTTELFANSGNSGGNAGSINISNSGGSVVITNAAQVRASALGTSGTGGTINIEAGSASFDGILSVTNSAEIEAESGSVAGSAGQISLSYIDELALGGITLSNGILDADGAVAGGLIRFHNNTLTGQPLVVTGSSASVSANNGRIDFDQPGGDVDVTLSNNSAPGPAVGKLESTGANVEIVISSTSSDIVIGDVTGTTSVALQLNSTGDMKSAAGTRITTPSLTVGADNGSIGASSTLLTEANTISPISGLVQSTVKISNDLPAATTTLADDWVVTNDFYFYSTANASIGTITKNTGTDGTIIVEQLGGTLTVRASSEIIAFQGSILIKVDVAEGGAMNIGADAQIGADANGSGSLMGNMLLQVGSPVSPSACGTIANFNAGGSAPPPVCGPSGFTASSPTNSALAVGRTLQIYSPDVSSLTLGGGVILNALN